MSFKPLTYGMIEPTLYIFKRRINIFKLTTGSDLSLSHIQKAMNSQLSLQRKSTRTTLCTAMEK